MRKVKVRANKNVLFGGGITIKEFGGKPTPGDEAIVNEDRLDVLATENNCAKKPLVEVISYIEETEEKPKLVAKKPTSKKKKAVKK